MGTEPPGYFERAAIKAAYKFKYKLVIDVEPLGVADVYNKNIFQMEMDYSGQSTAEEE
ncbi:MAG TPA: hypothetical protein VGL10_03980 [Gammaproteobacteria bacterium]